MDEHVIAPRRTLPPVPPAQRPAPGTTLAPPTPAPAAVDETSWYDPQDLLADSLVHTDLGPLADGSARQAAHDLVRESGRMLVLDEQLLAALDAAAKAAEARRALTAGLVPAPPAARPIAPPLAAADEVDEEFEDEFDDEDFADDEDDDLQDDLADDEQDLPTTAVGIDPATIDVAAEFARHDDLVETRRHPSIDDQPLTGASPLVTDTGRHHLALHDDDLEDDGVPTLGALSHRTVVTRGSSRRWIPVGVGAGVLSIVAAVVLTSGFGADTAATDEAARTGAVTTEAPAPSTTPTPPAPAMNTLDLSGPVVTGGSTQVDDDTASSTSPRTGSAVQPQVATPPAAPKPSTSGNGSTGNATSSPVTATAATPSNSSDTSGSGTSGTGTSGTGTSGTGTSGTGTSGTGSSDTGTPGSTTVDPGTAPGDPSGTQG